MHSRRFEAPRFGSIIPSIGGACALIAIFPFPARAEEPSPQVARRPHSMPTAVAPENRFLAPSLPALPEGTAELRFTDFFKTPVGPRGLELTDHLRSLDGKKVRILGYMVHEDQEPDGNEHAHAHEESPAIAKGRVLLTETPCLVSVSHYGLCDDLPPQTLFVAVPTSVKASVPFTPGPLLLTGRLSVGQKTEEDGRVSLVRLALDPLPNLPANSRSTQTSNQPKNP